jgi:orotate phosphoribosyltransferase
MKLPTFWSRSELSERLKTKAFKTGDFTLSSGKKSKYYVDLKLASLDPEFAWNLANQSWLLAKSEYLEKGLSFDGVGGLTLGADPLITALSMVAHLDGTSLAGLIVRKEAKGYGTLKWVEGIELLPKGSKVLVLEDVVTTGKSSVQAIERLRLSGLEPIGVHTLLDREEGGKEALSATGLKFTSLFTVSEWL